MGLPFTRDQFFDVFNDYNQLLWPMVLLLWILTAVTLLPLIRNRPVAQALITFMLITHWTWSAIAYHAFFFSRINPAAWLFSALFLLQAGLLWRHADRTHYVLSHRWSVRNAFSWMLVVYALIYPALVSLNGHLFPRAPAFGVPCPTTILTIGLLMAARPTSVVTAIIPIIWSLIGGSAAILFGVSADLMLLLAGAGLLMHIVVTLRRSERDLAVSTRILEKPRSS